MGEVVFIGNPEELDAKRKKERMASIRAELEELNRGVFRPLIGKLTELTLSGQNKLFKEGIEDIEEVIKDLLPYPNHPYEDSLGGRLQYVRSLNDSLMKDDVLRDIKYHLSLIFVSKEESLVAEIITLVANAIDYKSPSSTPQPHNA